MNWRHQRAIVLCECLTEQQLLKRQLWVTIGCIPRSFPVPASSLSVSPDLPDSL